MSEYTHVEQPLLTQLGGLGWTVVDQGSAMIRKTRRGRCAPASPTSFCRKCFATASVRSTGKTG